MKGSNALQQLDLSSTKDGVLLAVHARPGAARSQVAGVHGDALRVRVQAPPVEGRANKALTEFLAEVFQTPRRQVTITAGHRHSRKRVLLAGQTLAQVRHRLEKILADAEV